MTFEELKDACKMEDLGLRAVLSSAIYKSLVKRRPEGFRLTKKGARTAIYLLVVYEGVNYTKHEYQAIMQSLNSVLASSDMHAAAA